MEIIYIKFIEILIINNYKNIYLTLAFLALRKFIAPKIRKIPPTRIIHLLIFIKNSGNFMKFNPTLRKYIPNSKYRIKNNNPPLAIFKLKKKYI